jgi:hypothetical protein
VNAVANQLRRHVVAFEDGRSETGYAVANRCHAIEQVRRLPGAGFDPCDRLFVSGARVPERNVMTVSHQHSDEVERAVNLGRDGHDPHMRSGVGNLFEDLCARELAVVPARIRQPQTVERLRSLELRVDEIALEVRGKNPRRVRGQPGPRGGHRRQQPAQHIRSACDRCGAKRRGAVARQQGCDLRDRMGVVQRVVTADAVDVHVDEARHNVMAVEIGSAAGRHVRDAVPFDDDRAWAEQAIGKNDVGARQPDHG